MKDKRIFERLPKRLPVEAETARKTFVGNSIDISGQGAGISLGKGLVPDQDVCVRFSLSPEKTFSMRGRVVWSRQRSDTVWHTGIYLIDPSLFSLSQLTAS